MEIKDLHQRYLQCTGVSTDTRKIQANTMFFALKGDNFNANEFAKTALEKGAKFAVIDEKIDAEDPGLIRVSDALKTLQRLATYHRQYLGIPVIALTGSNGKTTTKELLNACLSKRYKTVATEGNLNNHIGVPLSLLKFTEQTEIGIIEMGANHAGEIAFLSEIALPDYGFITNFGKAHLEGFKSPEGVIAAKSELYEHLKKRKKLLFLNADDKVQWKQNHYQHIYSFGSSEEADLIITFPPADPYAAITVEGQEITSNLIGSYNSKNMAAAYTIGKYFGLSVQDLTAALKEYSPRNNRSQILKIGSKKLILDAYNANPTSMSAAVDNLDVLKTPHKIAILGDMFELGAFSREEHQNLVNRLDNSSIEVVYLVGENFYTTHTGSRFRKFRSFEDFRADFKPEEIEEATILIKGSRGMALERVVELFN